MLQSNILLSVNTKDSETDLLLKTLDHDCGNLTHEHSTIGIEIITLCLTAGQLLVALIALPIVAECLASKKVVFKMGGVTITDTPRDIVNMLKHMPDIQEQVIEALQKNCFNIQGDVKQIGVLIKELGMLGIKLDKKILNSHDE